MPDITSTLQALNQRQQNQFRDPISAIGDVVRPAEGINQALLDQQFTFNQFPEDLAPHRFVIFQGKIKPLTLVSGTGSLSIDFTNGFFDAITGAVSRTPYGFNKAHILPLPTTIQDSKNVQYNRNFNWQKALSSVARLFIGNAGAGSQTSGGTASAMSRAYNAGEQIAAGTGYAINNYKALTITQPEFRTFSLEFRLFPKNVKESQSIQKIITTIQTGMHPELKGGNGFSVFAFPDIFLCTFTTGQQGIDGAAYLYKFKPAVIASMSVNYQGDAPVPAFYKNPAGQAIPEGVIIRMGLIELEVWTRENFTNSLLGDTGLYNTDPFSALNVPPSPIKG